MLRFGRSRHAASGDASGAPFAGAGAAGPSAGERRVAVDSDDPSRPVVRQAADVLRSGGVVVLPTDTVYGIAQSVKACPEGARRLFQIKRRPPEKSIAWLVDDAFALRKYGAQVPGYAMGLAEVFWPGGLTIVVRAGDAVPAPFRGPGDTVALRMPNCQLDLRVIERLGCPIATTSANTSGLPAPDSYAALEERIREQADLVLDDGVTHSLVASTVVVCTAGEPRVVRTGSVEPEMIARIAGSVVVEG